MCKTLGSLLHQDTQLAAEIVACSQELDGDGDEASAAKAADLQRQVNGLRHKLEDLLELVGGGAESDRLAIKARIRQAQAEKASLESQLATVSSRLKRRTEPITPEQVFERLRNFSALLEDPMSLKSRWCD